jgi:hypothetical protein
MTKAQPRMQLIWRFGSRFCRWSLYLLALSIAYWLVGLLIAALIGLEGAASCEIRVVRMVPFAICLAKSVTLLLNLPIPLLFGPVELVRLSLIRENLSQLLLQPFFLGVATIHIAGWTYLISLCLSMLKKRTS